MDSLIHFNLYVIGFKEGGSLDGNRMKFPMMMHVTSQMSYLPKDVMTQVLMIFPCEEENDYDATNSIIVLKMPTTWKHGEDGSESIELESINDIAGVDQLQTHEAEAHHQQDDVQHLRNHW